MRNNCLQTGERRESSQFIGEIQEAVKKMLYARNRSDNSDGYILAC